MVGAGSILGTYLCFVVSNNYFGCYLLLLLLLLAVVVFLGSFSTFFRFELRVRSWLVLGLKIAVKAAGCGGAFIEILESERTQPGFWRASVRHVNIHQLACLV